MPYTRRRVDASDLRTPGWTPCPSLGRLLAPSNGDSDEQKLREELLGQIEVQAEAGEIATFLPLDRESHGETTSG